MYASPVNPSPRPLVRRKTGAVQVFASARPVEPHVEVARLEVRQDEGFDRQGLAYLIHRLREKAGELGCDAVFIQTRSGHVGAGALSALGSGDADTLLGSCIVYITPPVESVVADSP